MKTLEDIKKEMERYGYADLGTCYLEPREVVMEEKMEWAENDGCKGFDFSGYAYWLLPEPEGEPEGFESIEDALAYLATC